MADRPDQEQLAAGVLLDQLSGWAASVLLGLGLRTGLLDAVLACAGTAEQHAARAGTSVPSTREWLSAMVAAGHLVHRDGRYAARRGLVAALAPDSASPVDLRAMLELPMTAPLLHDELVRAVRDGTGIPGPELHAVFGSLADRLSARLLGAHLVQEWLPAVAGLPERLAAGVEVLDVGCGGGTVIALLAERYPASRYTGVDPNPGAVAAAVASVPARPGVEFRVGSVPPLPSGCRPGVVLLVNVLHDLPRPDHALRALVAGLAPGALVVAIESSATGDPGRDARRPGAVLGYFSSLTHCVQASVADGGEGPGALWGVDRVLAAFRTAGLGEPCCYESAAGRCVVSAAV